MSKPSTSSKNDRVAVMGDIDRQVLVSTLDKPSYPEKSKNTLTQKAKSFVSCIVGKLR
jgi:hypothetical protein